MFDIGWSEILVVAVIAVLVIGPDELPGVMRLLGRIVRRITYIRYAFSQQFEDFMRENDLDDIRKQVNFEAKDFDEHQSDEEQVLLSPPQEKASDGH